jgi:hypothetical protein
MMQRIVVKQTSQTCIKQNKIKQIQSLKQQKQHKSLTCDDTDPLRGRSECGLVTFAETRLPERPEPLPEPPEPRAGDSTDDSGELSPLRRTFGERRLFTLISRKIYIYKY